MINEVLLIISLIIIFGSTLLSFKLFGKSGLLAMSVVCTIAANIEVIMLVKAFGIEQTLGNVLFAATFLITDILSECYGKKEADKAVNIGIFISVFFIILTQSWFLYIPAENDIIASSVREVFKNTPRVMISSLAVYAICQKFDVWLYHKIWNLSTKKVGNQSGYLWLRNNGATLASQILNTVLFNIAAFWGIYSFKSIVSIMISSFVIYLFTSIADTPFLYLARKIFDKPKM